MMYPFTDSIHALIYVLMPCAGEETGTIREGEAATAERDEEHHVPDGEGRCPPPSRVLSNALVAQPRAAMVGTVATV